MAPNQDHLANARTYLAIAESGDAKREAYKLAADEIAAHIDESGDSQRKVAGYLQVTPATISKLLHWRKESYPPGTTPFTLAQPNGSLPTDRAAVSHARKVLRDPDLRQQLLEDHPEVATDMRSALAEQYAPHETPERHPPTGTLATAIKAVFALKLMVQRLRREEGSRDALEDERLLEQLNRADDLIGWARAFVREGSTDWDDAFAALVGEMDQEGAS